MILLNVIKQNHSHAWLIGPDAFGVLAHYDNFICG